MPLKVHPFTQKILLGQAPTAKTEPRPDSGTTREGSCPTQAPVEAPQILSQGQELFNNEVSNLNCRCSGVRMEL